MTIELINLTLAVVGVIASALYMHEKNYYAAACYGGAAAINFVVFLL